MSHEEEGLQAGFRLSLMGSWRLERAGAVVALPHRERRLVALLALRGARQRALVAGVLWPDASEEHARLSLRVSVLHVRQRAPGLLAQGDGALGLGPGVRVDVAALRSRIAGEASADSAERTRLVALSADAELLPGWYDDWVLLERERLEMQRLRALHGVAETALADGDLLTAVVAATEALSILPLSELALSVLMQALTRLGRKDVALARYHRFRATVRAEVGAEPSAALVRLAAGLGTSVPHPQQLPADRFADPLPQRSQSR